MDDHLGILEERIEAGAVGGQRSLFESEGARGEVEDQEKKDLDAGDDDRGIGEEALIGLVAEAENESIAGQQERPEQQRAFLSGPEDGELVGGGQLAVAVVVDVGDGEVVGKGGGDEHEGGEHDENEGGDAGAAGGFTQAGGSSVAAE